MNIKKVVENIYIGKTVLIFGFGEEIKSEFPEKTVLTIPIEEAKDYEIMHETVIIFKGEKYDNDDVYKLIQNISNLAFKNVVVLSSQDDYFFGEESGEFNQGFVSKHFARFEKKNKFKDEEGFLLTEFIHS